MRGLSGAFGRLLLVAVAAILIGGSSAAPAEASQRPAAANANAFVTFCFDSNGDVHVDVDGEVIRAICTIPGVGHYYCRFEGVSRDCEVIPRIQAPAGDQTVPAPGDLLALGAEPEEPAPERSGAVTAAADNQDDEQVHEPKPKKMKQAKHARKGKGKAKERGKGRGRR
jgi:hypothetical protein